MNEADVGALCDLMQSLENAVLVMSTVFKDDKAKLSKKAKQLIGAAEKAGLTAELVKPGPQDAKRFAVEKARELGAVLSPGAASELVERCGTDLFALESELSKLAAVADYGEITPELIAQMGTQSIEADVFEWCVLSRRAIKHGRWPSCLSCWNCKMSPLPLRRRCPARL